MTSHPVLITQDKEIELTVDNIDNEQMDKPILTMATTTQQAVKNFVVEESILKKNLFKKISMDFLKFQTYIPRRKILPPRRPIRRRNRDLLKPPDTLLKNPKTIPP